MRKVVLGRFLPDVDLILEWKMAVQEPVHQDPDCPDINLDAVVPVEYFRRPEEFSANCLGEPLLRFQRVSRAEVSQYNVALWVSDVLPVQQVVVPLDVPVHYRTLVEVLERRDHLVRHMDNPAAIDLAPLSQVRLHAFYEVTTRILVHDNADKALLVVDGVKPHDVVVVQTPHHVHLPPDAVHWRLDLVHHLDGDFEAGRLVDASVDDAESPLTELLMHGVFFKQPLRQTARRRGCRRHDDSLLSNLRATTAHVAVVSARKLETSAKMPMQARGSDGALVGLGGGAMPGSRT
mmetsp:Transcript_117911/g.328473  ORF Transcript_117911/g.328473 Transcript_117911/m.328473 type:complete len:292 (+) Transcript_117911:1717-2592(+)